MLRLAASEGDIVNIAPRAPIVGVAASGAPSFGLDIDAEMALIREAAGERYDEIEISVSSLQVQVTSDPEPALQKLQEHMRIGRDALMKMPHTLVGEAGALEERILEHRERFDISYRIIPGDRAEEFAPVVRRLAGS
jgi:hypothetical protein